MDISGARRLGDIIRDKNIVLRGADAATTKGFTQVPNFILRSQVLAPGDKLAFAVLLSYAWHNDCCFPGQERLAQDLGLAERSVRRHLKALQASGLLAIRRRGLGKTNIYEINLKAKLSAAADRTKMSAPDRPRAASPERTRMSAPL
jgi:DNA-binding transcriptional ArsR family regulator